MHRPHPAIPVIRGGSLASLKTFSMEGVISGVDNLDPNLTINGTTVTPTFRYKGGDADATGLDPWDYGVALALTQDGSGGSINYNDGSPGLGVNDDSLEIDPVNATNGKFYAASTQFGGIGTDDYAFEWLGTMPAAGTLVGKIDGSGDGWRFEATTGPIFRWRHDPGSHILVDSAALISGAWYHVLIFGDRSGSAQIYVNGVASGSAVAISGGAGDLDATANLAIGANNESGVGMIKHKFAYCALWNSASWLDTHLQATVASDRFAKLTGIYPSKAKGTAMPSTKTRAFPAYLDKIESSERKLYYVGGEWLRQCYRQDSSAVDVKGYLPETQTENLFPESEDFSTWDLIEAGTAVVDDAVECPDGRTKAGSIAGDTDDEQHGISDDITLTAATYCLSAFLKPGNKDWAYLSDSTVANAYCYFDVTNGTVGTSGAAATGYIEGPFNNGFYRCCIVFTGTAAAHTLEISPANADTDVDFSGDGSTVNTYVWGAQVEQSDYMTSPIITSGAAATRLSDQLRYSAGANIGGEDIGKGSIFADIYLSNARSLAGAHRIVSISDGGSSADYIGFFTDTSEDPSYVSAASGGNTGYAVSSTNLADDTKHTIAIKYETNNAAAAYDGVWGAADTTVDIPDDLDRIDFAKYDGTDQFNGLIQNVRIYKKPVKSG